MGDRRTNNKIFSASRVAELMSKGRGYTIPIIALDPFFHDYIKLYNLCTELLKSYKLEEQHKIREYLEKLDEII